MQEKDRKRALEIVIDQSMLDQKSRCNAANDVTIDTIIYDTIFQEKKRLASLEKTTQVNEEIAFWKTQEKLFYSKHEDKERILRNIITQFANEIIGGYNQKTYNFIIKILPYFLKFILTNEPFWKLFSKKGKQKVIDLVQIQGPTDKIKKLSERATLIVTPTHLSNFDSIVLGYATYAINIPPLAYGAGLNLFKNPILSFLMRNLGAYKVDREKKNELYKAVLKNYAAVTLQFGYHNLFYPGGTRSRSGKIEDHLKFGLLGSGLTSYLNGLKNNKAQKLVVVPCTINYGLCLEAKSLIKGHLQNEVGKKVILPKDNSMKLKNIFGFTAKLFKLNSKITVCFGEPLDLFGNELNDEGESIDQHGRIISIDKYVKINGKIVDSIQRDRTYTSILGQKILASFAKNNMVMETQLVSYAFIKACELTYNLPALKLLPLEEVSCNKALFESVLEFLKACIISKKEHQELKIDALIENSTNDQLVSSAINQLTSYHGGEILQHNPNNYYSKDLITLYYYHNRLTQYGLEKELAIWKK
jgi:glycerol-3-phosphate O-acyltransferase